MKTPTISDVASLAGVSKSTVSAVINGRDIVTDTTRRAVQRAIDELNYRPNASARRRFKGPGGRSIGFVVKEATNPYYAEILAGLLEVASEHDYIVFKSSSEGDPAREQLVIEQCVAREFDGLIITPTLNDETDLSYILELKRNNIPLVLLERIPGVQASLVDINNEMASYEAVKYLIQGGHSRIVHFAGPAYSEHSQERASGIRRAFSETHLVFDEQIVIHVGDSLEDGYRHGLDYFRAIGANAPTAVTCYNDLVALGLLKALHELRIRVPDDVSVIGFDDLEVLKYASVGLTSVHVPKYEMGRMAAEMLIRQIESRQEARIEKVSLAARLVVRESTRVLPSTSTMTVEKTELPSRPA